MGICSNNCPTHKGWVYLFPTLTHKTEIKRIIKIRKPRYTIEKTKGEKRKPTRKIEINKIFQKEKRKKERETKKIEK